ncbi:hypothetical protein F2Q69_00045769 [Brassica cretica]|uniref:RING-CH-type domain-containing protein n=1 Tax=Brassica cretica TaxID=69181 RepID=A0A8S9N223_BRACR|nr:hypothetical protein F2Q69_00045769 [Brassica cretica]
MTFLGIRQKVVESSDEIPTNFFSDKTIPTDSLEVEPFFADKYSRVIQSWLRKNELSAEITEEISPSQHERWRDLVFDIQLRPQENDFLRANGYFTPLLVPCRKDIEEGVALVYNGRDKSNIPRTWSLTNLLTPRKFKKTESLPVTPLAHSNLESMHGSYAVDDHVTSMKRERTLPIRRTRSVPTLIDKDGNVTPVGVLRVIPTPPRVDTESLEMMHEHDNGGEDVPEEEALCRICMVELGQDSEAFNMECMCKGELALAHRECTIKWFTIKGNITCDVCKQDVKNLPLTLLRVKDPQDRSSREAEHTWIQRLLTNGKVCRVLSCAVPVALPFACIIGLLAPVTSTTMVKRKYVWIFATIQFSFVVLFSHVFYSRIYVMSHFDSFFLF